MLGIDAAFLVLELGTGIYVGSLALMADAFHMVSRMLWSVVSRAGIVFRNQCCKLQSGMGHKLTEA